jgi:hypothetical protein
VHGMSHSAQDHECPLAWSDWTCERAFCLFPAVDLSVASDADWLRPGWGELNPIGAVWNAITEAPGFWTTEERRRWVASVDHSGPARQLDADCPLAHPCRSSGNEFAVKVCAVSETTPSEGRETWVGVYGYRQVDGFV